MNEQAAKEWLKKAWHNLSGAKIFYEVNHSNLFKKKIKFLSRVKKELSEQKIDIIFNTDSSRSIEKEAIKWGVRLYL